MFPISKSVASSTGDRVQIIATTGKTVRLFVYNDGNVGHEIQLDANAVNSLVGELIELTRLMADAKPAAKEAPAPKPAAKKKATKGK